MEGPYIKVTVKENYRDKETVDDNRFGHFIKKLEENNKQLSDALRSLTADSTNQKGKPRYVINQALLSNGLDWDALSNIVDNNDLKRELVSEIMLFWDDRTGNENEKRVADFIKKVVDIA